MVSLNPGVGRSLAWACTVYIAATYTVMLAPPPVIDLLAGREMIFETVGAVLFLVTSILFAGAARGAFRLRGTLHQTTRRGSHMTVAVLIGLSLLFFVAFGEELSWGQHALEFDTPESWRQLNAQEEVNLHNLWWFDSYDDDGEKKQGWRAWINSNRLFDYLMIGLFLLLPVASRGPRWVVSLLVRMGAPRVPMALAIPLAVNWLLTAVAELTRVDGQQHLHLAVSEIREHGYALSCCALGWFLFRCWSAAELSKGQAFDTRDRPL